MWNADVKLVPADLRAGKRALRRVCFWKDCTGNVSGFWQITGQAGKVDLKVS